VSRRIVVGEPSREILRAAREHGARLIVLGARTLRWLDRLTESSVSRAVLKSAPCPVVICRLPTEPAS
jgi:nucleotide-binding universal stress UspA family protein